VDPESIFSKPGEDWAGHEINFAAEWLFRSKDFDRLVRLAFVKLRDADVRDVDAYDLARDIVVDKFLDAIKYYSPGRERSRPFPSYLAWLVLDSEVPRTIFRVRRRPPPAVPLPPDVPAPDETQPDPDWCMAEPLLERLPPMYREALELCVLERLTCKEAGQRSRWPCSEGAMKVRVFRAKQELRRLLEDGESREDDR
jgi:DNA-directed RNA polymerase specialized sigma24 family protein